MSDQRNEFESRFNSWSINHPRTWSVQTDTTGLTGFLHAEFSRVREAQLEAAAHITNNLIASQERIAEGIDQVNFGVERISEGLESLNAAFEWGFSELIWQIEQTRMVLQQILEVLQKPLDTQAKELKRRADEAYRNGWFDEALADFLESEKRNRYDFSIHQGLGNIYLFDKKDSDKALEYFEKAAKYAKPKSAYHSSIALLHIGLVRYLQGDFDGAYVATSQAISLTPLLFEAHYQHAQYCVNLCKHAEALDHIRKAIEGDRYYAIKVFSEKDFDPIRKQLKLLITEMRNEKRREADSKITKTERLVQETESQEKKLSGYFEQTKKAINKARELMRRGSLYDCIDAFSEANKGQKAFREAIGLFCDDTEKGIKHEISEKESQITEMRNRAKKLVEEWSKGGGLIPGILAVVLYLFLPGALFSGVALLLTNGLAWQGLPSLQENYGQLFWTIFQWCAGISASILVIGLVFRERGRRKYDPELRSLKKEIDQLENRLDRFRAKYMKYLVE